MSEFSFVADDIEWFADHWWGRRTDGLSDGHIRRGSLTLATLFLDDLILHAWQHLGFTGEPQIAGPDLHALAARHNLWLRRAGAVVAGGGREDGDEVAFVGAFRIDNPETGTSADAEEGFAVQNTTIIRPEGLARAGGTLDADIEKLRPITEYLDAPAAVRRGLIVTRRDLLTFFRTHTAGVVRVSPDDGHSTPQSVKRAVLELLGRVQVNRRDGVYFELLSIGQAVGRSVDLQKLASAIRTKERAEQGSAPVMRTFDSPTGLPGFNHTLRLPEPAGAVDPDAHLSERLIRIESLDTPIYKTVRWRHVRALFEKGSMPAVAPRLWDDPFEKLVCETDVHAAGTTGAPRLLHTLRRVVYAQCWSLNRESDALWRIYSTVVKDLATNRNTTFDDEGLRVRTTPLRLLRGLWSATTPEIRQGLFLGRVRYSYARDALETIAAELLRQLQSNSHEAEALGTAESLLMKREPFAHEDECRLIIVDLREDATQQDLLPLSIGDANVVFRHVALDPRLSEDDVRNREARLRSYGFTGEIVHSQLYRPIRIDLRHVG